MFVLNTASRPESIEAAVSLMDRTKPSTACEPCRRRRAKCDRRRPQCSQCIRSFRTCTGYREQLDLVIRSENDKIKQRLQAKKRASSENVTSASSYWPDTSIRKHSDNSLIRESGSISADAALQRTSLISPPNQSSRDVAVNFFFSSFAQGVYLDYLPELYRATDRSTIFEASFEAVAISYFAKCHSRSDLMHAAIQKYSVALQEMTEALSVSSKATRDDTIASVLLLALFAALSSDPAEASRTWTKHITGAMVLIGLKSSDSFGGSVVQTLLSHVISAIQLDCIQGRLSLPPQLAGLCELSILATFPFQSQFWNLIDAMASLRECASRDDVDDLVVVKQALILDQQALSLLNAMPTSQSIKLDLKETLGTLWERSNLRIAQAWNTLRMVRMGLNELIIFYGAQHLSSSSDPATSTRNWLTLQVNEAAEVMKKEVAEICESVPAYLQTHPTRPAHRPDSTRLICSHIWPLARATASNLLPADLRARARRHLQNFAEISDNPQISRIASQAMHQQSVQDWVHVLYLC